MRGALGSSRYLGGKRERISSRVQEYCNSDEKSNGKDRDTLIECTLLSHALPGNIDAGVLKKPKRTCVIWQTLSRIGKCASRVGLLTTVALVVSFDEWTK